MPIPDFQTLMLPALQHVAEKKGPVAVRDLSKELAKTFSLTEEELSRLLPSGRAPQFYNRVQWAAFHLRKARLFDTPKRAFLALTDRGKQLLAHKPERVDMQTLLQYAEYAEFRSKDPAPREDIEKQPIQSSTADTPL